MAGRRKRRSGGLGFLAIASVLFVIGIAFLGKAVVAGLLILGLVGGLAFVGLMR